MVKPVTDLFLKPNRVGAAAVLGTAQLQPVIGMKTISPDIMVRWCFLSPEDPGVAGYSVSVRLRCTKQERDSLHRKILGCYCEGALGTYRERGLLG